LILPKNQREDIIPSLAHALVNWRITSNQARTFSLMETLAIAVSNNANQIAYAIRGELREDVDRQAAVPRIDETAKADIFVTPSCSGHVQGAVGSADAIDKAAQKLIDLMMAFDYENQML
jgi:monoamine oxidase